MKKTRHADHERRFARRVLLEDHVLNMWAFVTEEEGQGGLEVVGDEEVEQVFLKIPILGINLPDLWVKHVHKPHCEKVIFDYEEFGSVTTQKVFFKLQPDLS